MLVPITDVPLYNPIIRAQLPQLPHTVSRPWLFSVGLCSMGIPTAGDQWYPLALTGYPFPKDYVLGESSIGKMYNLILGIYRYHSFIS